MFRRFPLLFLLILLTVLMANGCESRDERIARLAEYTVAEQARQNERLAKQHEKIAHASREILEAEGRSREQFLSLNQALQTERAEIGQQRDVLELERKELARHRYLDPIIASAILEAGVVLGCLLPLVVCILVLRSLTMGSDDESAMNDLLVNEIIDEQRYVMLQSAEKSPALYDQRKR